MLKKSFKYSLGLIVLLLAVCGTMALFAKPIPNHPYFRSDDFLVIAHRGGRSLGPENTLYTFQHAADLGVDVLELDLRSTKDGHLVVIHDKTVDRTTTGTGRVDSYDLNDLKKLDAAYRWSAKTGTPYPLRGKGIQIPTLSDVFEAFPEKRINIEIKDTRPDPIAKICRTIREHNMTDNVIIASFTAGALDEFRTLCPEVATSAGASEAILFYWLQWLHLVSIYSPDAQALQVPEKYGDNSIVDQRFLEAAHNRNMRVHVWTVNDDKTMKQLIKLGVDGIMTDYPQRLLEILNATQ
jgi:glycerophosphoryl diester phosphodiesterase